MKKIGILLFSFVLLLASCSTAKPSTAKMLRLASENDFATLHPHKTSSGVDFQNIGQYLQTLFVYDESGKLSPGAAASYSVSDDGLTYSFELQPHALWSNGDRVTASDFAFTWKLLASDKQADYRSFLKNVKNGSAIINNELPADQLGVTAVNDLLLEVTLERPLAYFVDILAFPTMAPINQKFYEDHADTYGMTALTTVANGPFSIKEFQPDTEIIFEKNINYWDQASVNLDTVSMRVIKDQSTQSLLFDDFELDMILVDGELNVKYENAPGVATGISPSIIYFYLSNIGAENSPLTNKNFRQAISTAIDKEIITNSILKNGSKPLDTLIPENFGDFDGQTYRELDPSPKETRFNLEKAQELLAVAKMELTDIPLTFELNFPDSALFRNVYENVKAQLEANLPGVLVTLNAQPSNLYYSEIMKKQTPAGHGQWGVDYEDVQSFFTLFESTSNYNYGNYQNAAFDASYHKGDSVELAGSPLERAAAYFPAEAQVLDDAVFIPLYQRATKWIAHDNVSGITLSPIMPARQYRFVTVA
ncbi:murein tripeptide (L-ala-gamma-D-glutamyl-meso-DAP) transporter subunit [Erysipelotrichaceae bacterium]|nr:murein tripeptide (L-ala-gamma-D-glutamyl-meso-DAP) transporter subunit [Erysipelotrichaceae bacterium]